MICDHKEHYKFGLCTKRSFSFVGRKGEHQQGPLHHGPVHLVMESASVHPGPNSHQRKKDQAHGKKVFSLYNIWM